MLSPRRNDPTASAELGLRGSSSALPYRSRLERALGANLGGIESHRGEDSGRACRQLGAKAYAVGEKVAFKEASPDLATVAHEVTHVLQHRNGAGGGVHLKSEVGRPTDAAELEADDVASRVLAGQPVEVSGRPSAGIHLSPDPAARVCQSVEGDVQEPEWCEEAPEPEGDGEVEYADELVSPDDHEHDHEDATSDGTGAESSAATADPSPSVEPDVAAGVEPDGGGDLDAGVEADAGEYGAGTELDAGVGDPQAELDASVSDAGSHAGAATDAQSCEEWTQQLDQCAHEQLAACVERQPGASQVKPAGVTEPGEQGEASAMEWELQSAGCGSGPGYPPKCLEGVPEEVQRECLDNAVDVDWMAAMHGALDAAGLIPALGIVPDGINFLVYLVEGDLEGAAWAGAAMLPLAGLGVTVAKNGLKISKKAVQELGPDAVAAGLKKGMPKTPKPDGSVPSGKTPDAEMGPAPDPLGGLDAKEVDDFVDGAEAATMEAGAHIQMPGQHPSKPDVGLQDLRLEPDGAKTLPYHPIHELKDIKGAPANRVQVRNHSPNPNAPDGSYSKSNPTTQINTRKVTQYQLPDGSWKTTHELSPSELGELQRAGAPKRKTKLYQTAEGEWVELNHATEAQKASAHMP